MRRKSRSVSSKTLALFVALVLSVSLLGMVQPRRASAEAIFTITGRGWGHGIGMSQWGAYGYAAKAGWTYQQILAHYYQKTTVGTAPAKWPVVNLDAERASRSSWVLRPGHVGRTLIIGGVDTKVDGAFTFKASAGTIGVYNSSGKLWKSFASPLTVAESGPGTRMVQVVSASGPFKRTYTTWRGSMRIKSSGSTVKLLNVVDLESYLYGVVPREMPASWSTEAVKAQAVAARSYAYVGSGELACTTASQVYGGYGRDSARLYKEMATSPYWTGRYEDARSNAAVNATAGKVVKYGSSVITTYFFSTSGGYTANKEDIWGGTHAAYWSAVPDPYESAVGATYSRSWGNPLVYTGPKLGSALRLGSSVNKLVVNRGAGDWAKGVTAYLADGRAVQITSSQFRQRLNSAAGKEVVRSQKFYVRGTLMPVRFEQSDSRITQNGSWSVASTATASDGSYVQSRAGSLTVPFQGTEISWVAPTGRDCGRAQIVLDGVVQKTVSLYSASDAGQVTVWTRSGLPNKRHTLVIKALEQKDAASTDTWVGLDALDVVGSLQEPGTVRFEQDDRRIGKSGSWANGANYVSSGREYGYTRTAGSSVTVPFHGTSATLIGERHPSYGLASVYLDGVYSGDVDYYAAYSRPQSALWRAAGLTDSDHTLRLVCLGRANQSNTTGGFSVNIDAVDVAGAVRAAGVVRAEQNSAAVKPISAWRSTSSPDYSARSTAYSVATGAELDVAFYGTGISWIGPRLPSAGMGQVYVDGTYAGLADEYSSLQRNQSLLRRIGGLTPGMHRVTVRAKGTKNAKSSGSAIRVDAFDIAGTPATIIDQTDPRITFRRGWATGSSWRLSGRTMRYSRTAGAKAFTDVRGSALTLVGNRAPTYGKLRVWIDGKAVATVQCKSSVVRYRVPIWRTSGLDPAVKHRVVFEVLGTGYVAFDALDVVGTLATP